MKKILVLFVLLHISSICICQTQTASYFLNAEQVKNNTPAGKINIDLENMKRDTEIKISTTRDTLTKSFLSKEVFALKINDTLWLNGKRHKISKRYYKALTAGNFIAFKGAMENSKVLGIIIPSAIGFGLIGASVASLIISPKRYLYVTSLRTRNTKRLTKDYIIQRITETGNTNLLNEYNTEPDNRSPWVLLKYVDLLNENLNANPPAQSPNKN